MNIRKPVAAGSFYPGEKMELQNLLKGLTLPGKVRPSEVSSVKALIVPHAGYIYSGKVAAEGFKQIMTGKPRKASPRGRHYVLIGPSHHFPFEGLTGSSASYWETPLGRIRQVPPSPRRLAGYGEAKQIFINDEAHEPEHSIEVELPFLQALYSNEKFSVTCLLTGLKVGAEKEAKYLLKNYPEAIFIFSSDLSHYLPEETARKKDKKTIEAILNLDNEYFNQKENAACGAEGIKILIEMARKQRWQGRLIVYDTSARASGDKKNVVGYASLVFYR